MDGPNGEVWINPKVSGKSYWRVAKRNLISEEEVEELNLSDECPFSLLRERESARPLVRSVSTGSADGTMTLEIGSYALGR